MPRVKVELTDEQCRMIRDLRKMGYDWWEISKRVKYWYERVPMEYNAWCRRNGLEVLE